MLLLGQVLLARHMEQQVDATFFLLRAVGYATFIFQGDDVQLALAIKELPEGSVAHSERVAITLLVIGGLFLIATPFVRRRRKR